MRNDDSYTVKQYTKLFNESASDGLETAVCDLNTLSDTLEMCLDQMGVSDILVSAARGEAFAMAQLMRLAFKREQQLGMIRKI